MPDLGQVNTEFWVVLSAAISFCNNDDIRHDCGTWPSHARLIHNLLYLGEDSGQQASPWHPTGDSMEQCRFQCPT
jgi:hypothetical protein